jgi:hypothetical protein
MIRVESARSRVKNDATVFSNVRQIRRWSGNRERGRLVEIPLERRHVELLGSFEREYRRLHDDRRRQQRRRQANAAAAELG